MKREFLLLAHKYNPASHRNIINGWLVSEKLDGVRCLWDGGVSIGIPCKDVPYANTEKDSRYKDERIATGLWSRYGKPIYAPTYFIDQLPPFCLDGELYSGRGTFQQTISTVKDLVPNENWKQIRYHVFDAPSYREVLCNGEINNINFKKQFIDCSEWAIRRIKEPLDNKFLRGAKYFEETYQLLQSLIPDSENLKVHEQVQLPLDKDEAIRKIDSWLEMTVADGGEGLMLRNPSSFWVPGRSHSLLKVKAYHDEEGVVVSYKWGKEGKLLGLMGSLTLDFKGKRFDLSGFTDEERVMVYDPFHLYPFRVEDMKKLAYAEGVRHPGEVCRADCFSVAFPIGTKVTFRYRELTDEGIPKEASFLRKHNET